MGVAVVVGFRQSVQPRFGIRVAESGWMRFLEGTFYLTYRVGRKRELSSKSTAQLIYPATYNYPLCFDTDEVLNSYRSPASIEASSMGI